MVFQATLSGTNYFKRPPLYHNRERKKEGKKKSPISTSRKVSTQELIIEPWRWLDCLPGEARHGSIYLRKAEILLLFLGAFLSPKDMLRCRKFTVTATQSLTGCLTLV